MLNDPVLSPDGKRVAFTVTDDPKLDEHGFRRTRVFVRELHNKKDPHRTFAITALNVFWSPDRPAGMMARSRSSCSGRPRRRMHSPR